MKAVAIFGPTAAGKTGVMSTGMSVRRLVTDSISGVDTPYLVSKRWARA